MEQSQWLSQGVSQWLAEGNGGGSEWSGGHNGGGVTTLSGPWQLGGDTKSPYKTFLFSYDSHETLWVIKKNESPSCCILNLDNKKASDVCLIGK